MKREIKEQLGRIYEAPPPLHKKEFLQKWNYPSMSLMEFLTSQAAYIRKRNWGISAIVFVIAMFGAVMASKNLVWIISAFTPLLALTVLTECGRSENYEMEELEMATRFSLKSVILARMGILGMGNMIVLCFLLAVGIWDEALEPVQAGICIIMPYLLTAFIGLHIVRMVKGQEAVYFCVGAAVCVGSSVFLFREKFLQLYKGWNPLWWGGIVLLLCIGVARQYGGIINRTEELT
ncbi:MAG: hypothetical protein K2J99_00280 [Lachnospiraceae bacterium]|nr:hypothetical protein [Lachnospiraceae bacterium]